jgi:methylase of polypeptide subunit release factors
MGTGTGIISLFLKLVANELPNFNPKIYASDITKEAIYCALENKKLNQIEGKIHYIQSDLFKSFPRNLMHKFNVIIFNPPYLPSLEIQAEKKRKIKDLSWDGGNKGYEVLIEFFNQVRPFLSTNNISLIYFITSNRINIRFISKIINKIGFQMSELKKIHYFFEDIILNRAILTQY